MNSEHTVENTTEIVGGFETIRISPDRRRKWDDTLSMMTWVAPGFLHILYKLLNAQNNTTGNYVAIHSLDVPVAATDGLNIIVNPETYYSWTLPERVFVLAHEIWHNMVDDVSLLHRCSELGYVLMPEGDKLPFDNDRMQRSMDARINASLIEGKIGTPPKDGWFDKDVKPVDSVFTVYRRYHEKEHRGTGPTGGIPKQPQGKPGQQPGLKGDVGKPCLGNDVLKPGAATGKGAQETTNARNPEQWAVELTMARTLEDQRSQGNMPMGMRRMFQNMLEPEIYWLDNVETLVKRHVGDGSVNWHEPNPWLGHNDYFVPSDTGEGAGWVVIWGDTSGSMGDPAIAKSISETAGLWEQVNPKRLTLIWCDAAISKKGSVNEITDIEDLRNAKPVGGGGTDYSPVLKWIANNNRGEQPDLFIGFTDGYVTFPNGGHPFPTIWACHTETKFPFGQVVRVKPKGARA